MERGINIIFPLILRLFGRIFSGEEEGKFGEEYQVVRNFLRALYSVQLLIFSVVNVNNCQGFAYDISESDYSTADTSTTSRQGYRANITRLG